MAKINFIAGPMGGGSAELAGGLAYFVRKQSPAFEYPANYENGVYVGGIILKEEGSTGFKEAAYIKDHADILTFDKQSQLLADLISSQPDNFEFFVGGIGISMFIEQFHNLYPTANIYFVKRVNSNTELAGLNYHILTNNLLPVEGLTEYILNLNSQIRTSIDSLVAKLSLSWTSSITNQSSFNDSKDHLNQTQESYINDSIIFLTPTLVATHIYRIQVVF